MTGMASWEYYTHSDVIDVPEKFLLVTGTGAKALIRSLEKLVEWFHAIPDKPLRITAEEEARFQKATACYVCEKTFFNAQEDNFMVVRWMMQNKARWNPNNERKMGCTFSRAVKVIKTVPRCV